GNPSTLYSVGQDVAEVVETARRQVADLIGARPREMYFTSRGTQSDNWAIRGTVVKSKGGHAVTSKIEHHAVLETCKDLEREGVEVTWVGVDEDGLVSPDDVAAAVGDDTALVTIMHANNEVGTIEPIAGISEVTRERGVPLHTDAVQTVGKIAVDVDDLGCDLLSISAHKLYGPKGVGALYIRRGTRIAKFMHGGEQENRRRSGTLNVAGIVGLGVAAELAKQELGTEMPRLAGLRDRLIDGIMAAIPDCRLSGPRDRRLPHNAHFCFRGIEGEGLVLRLDHHGICAATGSACTSSTLEASHVLLAMGRPHEIAHGSLRLTLGRDNSEDDVDRVLEVLPEIVAQLRAMSPLYQPGD
ncbi:MAG: aminotransferase class V-fold PLP-dependent enzyme, partial [Planctomycetota bacterium]